MARAVATMLMFEGTAEQALSLSVSLFKGSEVTRLERYGPGEQGRREEPGQAGPPPSRTFRRPSCATPPAGTC